MIDIFLPEKVGLEFRVCGKRIGRMFEFHLLDPWGSSTFQMVSLEDGLPGRM